MTDLSSLDRLLERFPEQEPASGDPLPWFMVPQGFRWHGTDPLFPAAIWALAPESDPERLPVCVVDYGDDNHAPTRDGAKVTAAYLVLAANAYPELRSALVALREELADSEAAGATWKMESVKLMGELVALREELVKTRAEVDRLDGIRGELVAELTEAHRLLILERDHKDEARRLAEKLRGMGVKRGAGIVLPWELGAPAAGREEGKT